MLEILVVILITIIFVGLMFIMILEGNYYSYLCEKHPDLWKQWGDPQVSLRMSWKIQNIIKKFEAKKEYFALKDTKLEKMIYWKEKFKISYLVVFILINLIIILMLFYFHQ